MSSSQKLLINLLYFVLHSWSYKSSAAEKSSYADFGMVDLMFIQSHCGPFMLKQEPLGKWFFATILISACLVVKEGLKVYLFTWKSHNLKHLFSTTARSRKAVGNLCYQCWKTQAKIWCVGKHCTLNWSLTWDSVLSLSSEIPHLDGKRWNLCGMQMF